MFASPLEAEFTSTRSLAANSRRPDLLFQGRCLACAALLWETLARGSRCR